MNAWPELDFHDWTDTRQTLHRWTQIVGKISLDLSPLVNHFWNAALHVTPRGVTTGSLPCPDGRSLEIEFDFLDHALHLRDSSGDTRQIRLEPKSVASFYREIFDHLDSLRIPVRIWPVPVEIPDETTPLNVDERHASYDPDAVERFFRALLASTRVLEEFRTGFIGKCSPVHFFWGSFDLAVTRFSGRPAPPRDGADSITREAYSHEVSSVGFWTGDDRLPKATYYSYAAPEPHGFRTAHVAPDAAYYNEAFGGFYLDYDVVRTANDPTAELLAFCRSTYEAAANLGDWDRSALERTSSSES